MASQDATHRNARFNGALFVKPIVWLFYFVVSVSVSVGHAGERYNILWICAEDLSPFFGCYGHPEATTPEIDAFASESLLFQEALTTAPICAPSRSSLATGMYAHSIGTQHLRSEVRIPDSIRPLAQVFQENGYWTALRGKSDYNFSSDGLFDYKRFDGAPWRKCPEGKPFFIFMNLGLTHEGRGNITPKANEALAPLETTRRHDPEQTKLPPYFPKTKEMRRLWARYHDLATVFDQDFAEVMDRLEQDGLAENTIVFLFADHGHGMPRYKRWLYRTGLQVPLIIRHPEMKPGRIERPVSMIDLPPTALNMAGIAVPEIYQGSPLTMESSTNPGGTWPVFGARDRADDMYDLSRLIYDGEFIYIRHFQPHLPMIQEGKIFSDRKDTMRELRRVHLAGQDTAESRKLWEPRPAEELYQISSDPYELNNLANDPKFLERKRKLSQDLRQHLLDIRDSGFLLEPEMERRSQEANLTPYELVQRDDKYDLETILRVAWDSPQKDLSHLVNDEDPTVQFWALQSGWNQAKIPSAKLVPLLQDGNPHVEITAAGLLADSSGAELRSKAEAVFLRYLDAPEPRLQLYNARTLALAPTGTGKKLKTPIQQTLKSLANPDPNAKLPYRDFMYSAFTSWSLEWSLEK